MELFKGKRNQLFTTLYLDLGNILVGYLTGWSAPVISKLQNPDETPLSEVISLTQCSWLGSLHMSGLIVGPFISGCVANKYGRKPCTIIAAVVYIFGAILLLAANDFAIILAGRIVTGIGSGIITVNNVVYIGEIASPNIRGILLTSTGVAHCFAVLLAFSVGLFSYTTIGYVLLVLSLFYALGCFYIPESPVFHMIKGKESTAISTLQYLGRNKEIEEIESLNEKPAEQDWKLFDIFKIRSNRRSLFIACPLVIFQFCGGIIAVSYFNTTIFEAANSSIEPEVATIIIGATQFIGTLVVPQIIEKAGRRMLLLISTAGCCITFVLLGIYFYLQHAANHLVASIGWLPLFLLMFTYVVFSLGLNIVPNTLLGELFNPNVRSIGTSLCIATAALAATIKLSCFGYIVENIGIHIIFWAFSIVNAVAFIFTMLVVPETKGMTLDEILVKLSN